MSLVPHSLNTKMNENLAFWLVQLPFLLKKAFEYSSAQGLLQLQIHGSKDLNVVNTLKSALIFHKENSQCPGCNCSSLGPWVKKKKYLVEDTDLNLSWLLRHLRNNEIWIAPPRPIEQANCASPTLWLPLTRPQPAQGDSYSPIEPSTTHPHQHSDCCVREDLQLIPGCHISLFINFHYYHMLCSVGW